MTKICYQDKNFKASSLAVIEEANKIIIEYAAQGFSLTLRQLYYQFVARDLIPNSQREYKRIGSIINDGRMAGRIDWLAIEDRTRNLKANSHWASPADILISASQSFALDKWADQDVYIEVWIEKEALIGVVEPVCRKWDVPFFACRGYTSQSEQWRAGVRMGKVLASGRDPIILHFGDHDPSGIDMTRDNRDRLFIFAEDNVTVIRLALNMDQVEEYNPPPNPAKLTDSRVNGYLAEYGESSWELDALNPQVISGLIETDIRRFLDFDKWDAMTAQEVQHQEAIAKLAADWKD